MSANRLAWCRTENPRSLNGLYGRQMFSVWARRKARPACIKQTQKRAANPKVSDPVMAGSRLVNGSELRLSLALWGRLSLNNRVRLANVE